MVVLPPLGDQILKKEYTRSEIRQMRIENKAIVLPYRIDLSNRYSRDDVVIKERVSVDPETLRTWFAFKGFYNIKKDVKPKVYEAIEKMSRNTDRMIFKSSSESDPFVMINALPSADMGITDEIVKYFNELEAIVIAEEQLLKKD